MYINLNFNFNLNEYLNTLTTLEEIADHFIEDVLGDHPITMYFLDDELREYLSSKRNRYNEYLKQIAEEDRRGKEAMHNMTTKELADAVLKAYELPQYEGEEELLNTMKQEYLQSISARGDLLLRKLTQLVMESDKVRIRIIHELEEAEQEDVYMPNVWAYHKNCKSKDVVDYILDEYDFFRQEDEIEEKDTER